MILVTESLPLHVNAILFFIAIVAWPFLGKHVSLISRIRCCFLSRNADIKLNRSSMVTITAQ